MAADPTRRFISTTVEVEGREETKIVELPARTLTPWDADARLDIVGTAQPRVDARDKVTGAAIYTSDRLPPALLHVALVPIARPSRPGEVDRPRSRASHARRGGHAGLR
jgi:hypothetical protein